MSQVKTQEVQINKTGVILVKPWLTKSVTRGQTLDLTQGEYQAATAQGFLEEDGSENEKAAKTKKKSSKRPGSKSSPVEEVKNSK